MSIFHAPAPATACPIVFAFARHIVTHVEERADTINQRQAAVELSKAPRAVEAARAVFLIEYVVKECLPRAFNLFQLPRGSAALSDLPSLHTPEALQQYADVLCALNEQPWASACAGKTLMRDSLLRPLVAAEKSIRLLAMGETALIGSLLAPAVERLSHSVKLVGLLSDLLSITQVSSVSTVWSAAPVPELYAA